MGAILSYLLIKLSGVDREIIEKWLYCHRRPHLPQRHPGHRPPLLLDRHARSTGSPVGGLFFSALEPLAFLGMALYTVTMARKRRPEVTRTAWRCTGAVGCGIMSFVGAGFLGFAHTLPRSTSGPTEPW